MDYLSIFVGLIPSFVWLYFFIREDEAHPEPKMLILYAFIAGGLSTFFVIGPQMFLGDVLPGFGVGIYSPAALTVLSTLEEFFKFFAVYLVISWRRDFDEPLDAMVYMIVAALGFAAVENVASALKGTLPWLGGPSNVEITSLRFVGATLLHSLSSALVGYYWGMAMKSRGGQALLIAEGIGVATLLHTVFNSLILKYGPETFVATLLLVAAAFFVLNDFEKLKFPR